MLILLIALALVVNAQDSFQLTSIFVTNQAVGANTLFNYQLQINRGSDYQVGDGDYLILIIPSDTTAYWDESSAPTCLVGTSESS